MATIWRPMGYQLPATAGDIDTSGAANAATEAALRNSAAAGMTDTPAPSTAAGHAHILVGGIACSTGSADHRAT